MNDVEPSASASKLEMLGALFQRGCMSKLYKNHLDKAIEKFEGALSINNSSEKAIHGSSRCLLQRFLNTRNKKEEYHDLPEARKRMEKLKKSSFVPHLLTLAQIYSETSLLDNDDKTYRKAEEIYEKIIDLCKKPKEKVLQLCEG